jgi:creatinine amidohydrolase
MRKWNLALMNSGEIGAIPKDDALLLLPVGCVEQHGPVGFTGADTYLAEYVCHRAAERLDGVYVAPPLWFGYTPYTSFAGTVSLRLHTLEAVVQDVVEGYLAHGFRHLVVVNNHGPNEAAIEPVAARVRRQHGVVVGILYPWRLANHVSADLYPDARAVFGHGGEPTISVMMALSPGTIDPAQKGARGYVSPDHSFQVTSYRAARFGGFEVGMFNEASHVLPTGASGDWTVATEERGREILRRMVDYAVEFLPAFLRVSRERVRNRS